MITQSFKMAWKSIRSNKMRSFLTMLGIIIGVFSLVVLVSLVSGASNEITDAVNSIGTNLISVSVMDDKGKPLKMSDLESFEAEDVIAATAPATQSSMTAVSELDEKSINVTGTTAAYLSIQNLTLESGRFLLLPDEENHSLVAVINHDAAIDLLGRADVVGETLRMNGLNYRIIGVLEKNENDMSAMFGSVYEAYIPLSTLLRTGEGITSDITTFYVSASDENLDEAEAYLNEVLTRRFDADDDAFMLFNQSTIADVMGEITGVLSLLLGGIAAISLLVGGIGIMNIMLVSVTERTREIGIRKAIGAGEGSILLQFLIEALMVSLLGCIFGLLISALALRIINRIGDVSYGVDPQIAVVAVVFSILIGVLFGLYPARKAARKKPIDALRHH